jgi:zinc transport system substrate-binding protein
LRNAPSALLACAAALALAVVPACGEPPASAPRAEVAVTIPPLAWFVERLLGDPARVVALLPPGANPHSFEPGLAEIRAAARADLLVEVGHRGLPFEEAASLALLGDRHAIASVVAAPPEALSQPDPHVWLSPRIARGMAARIADALAAAAPPQSAAIRARQTALDAELAALDAEIRDRLLPYRDRAFLTYHPDWTAFAADYGLRQLTLERGHREPDAAALAARIAEAQREGVRVLFVQPQYSRESAELVAAEIGARVVSIDPLSRDWPGTLRAMTDALVESFAR